MYLQRAPHGGIRPPPRRRSRLALTLAEREEISRAIALDQSGRSIARLLGRSPSSVSREISRSGGYDRYRAAPADEQAWNRARRPKRCKLATNSRLRRSIAEKLRLNWAPEQIAGWLKRTYPEDESCRSRLSSSRVILIKLSGASICRARSYRTDRCKRMDRGLRTHGPDLVRAAGRIRRRAGNAGYS